jgi:RimJ/RimL family protein N-acetyltransferase
MKVRLATPLDMPDLIRMMKNYRQNSPISALKTAENERYVANIFTHILAGRGAIFVVENDLKVFGMLVAILNHNIWDPSVLVLNELAYWVDLEHRGTSAGYRLLEAYRQHATEMVNEKKIRFFTMSKMINSPDLKYERFGFEKLEEMWRSQECHQV